MRNAETHAIYTKRRQLAHERQLALLVDVFVHRTRTGNEKNSSSSSTSSTEESEENKRGTWARTWVRHQSDSQPNSPARSFWQQLRHADPISDVQCRLRAREQQLNTAWRQQVRTLALGPWNTSLIIFTTDVVQSRLARSLFLLYRDQYKGKSGLATWY